MLYQGVRWHTNCNKGCHMLEYQYTKHACGYQLLGSIERIPGVRNINLFQSLIYRPKIGFVQDEIKSHGHFRLLSNSFSIRNSMDKQFRLLNQKYSFHFESIIQSCSPTSMLIIIQIHSYLGIAGRCKQSKSVGREFFYTKFHFFVEQ